MGQCDMSVKAVLMKTGLKKSLLSGLTNFDSLGYIRSDGRKLNRVNKPDKED